MPHLGKTLKENYGNFQFVKKDYQKIVNKNNYNNNDTLHCTKEPKNKIIFYTILKHLRS